MRPPILALLATLIAAVWLWLAACGSIVRSTEETSPPPHGSEMKGLAYWLPKGSIIMDGTWEKDSKDCSIKVTTLVEADTRSRWRLTRKVNHLFEDTVAIEVDPATGLLKSLNGTSEDKTADIVATALQSAAKVVTAVSAPAVTKASFVEEAEMPCGPSITRIELTAPFHFKIPVEQVLGRNNNYCQTFKIIGPPSTPTPAPSGPTPTPPSSSQTPFPSVVRFTVRISREDKAASLTGKQNGKRIDNNAIVDGIVVRAPVPYRMTIEKSDPNLLAEQQLFLPDPERIYYLPLDRTPFVKNETRIVLVGGVVQSVSVTRPSIVRGIVGIPKTILEALIPLLSH